MIVHLDAASPLPPYAQLRIQIAASIRSGRLPDGHQLPPIRQLASDLDLAPGTVARAYRELEADGLVVSHGRRGTRVAAAAYAAPASGTVDERLAAAVDHLADIAAELGIPPEETGELVRAALVDRRLRRERT